MASDAETLARAVREELVAAGLPVTSGDAALDSTLTTGAHVYVDEVGDVNIHWKTHFVLRSAAMEALSRGQVDDPSIHLNGKTAEAMQDAIAEILTAAGYRVTKDANDMAPSHLLVQEPPRQAEPSWRDWLSQQTARLQRQLMTKPRQ
jgi:hypothetical protein